MGGMRKGMYDDAIEAWLIESVRTKGGPIEFDELMRRCPFHFSDTRVREILWHLFSMGRLELTPDRKVAPGSETNPKPKLEAKRESPEKLVSDSCGGDDIYVDESGDAIEILRFFSTVFIDGEMRRLGKKYQIHTCSGGQKIGTLGKAEKEYLVSYVLGLVRVIDANPLSLCGVRKDELERGTARGYENYFINQLVGDGYLREKMILGVLVVFPTEKLLRNQGIPLRHGRQ